MSDNTTQDKDIEQKRNLRYTPSTSGMTVKQQIALLVEASLSSTLEIVSINGNNSDPAGLLADAYRDSSVCPEVGYMAVDGRSLTARFTERGNLMLRVARDDKRDYKHYFSEAENALGNSDHKATVERYFSVGAINESAQVDNEDNEESAIDEKQRDAAQDALSQDGNTYQNKIETPVTGRDSASDGHISPGEQKQIDTGEENNAESVDPNAAAGDKHSHVIDVPNNMIDDETTGFFPIPLKKMDADEARAISGSDDRDGSSDNDSGDKHDIAGSQAAPSVDRDDCQIIDQGSDQNAGGDADKTIRLDQGVIPAIDIDSASTTKLSEKNSDGSIGSHVSGDDPDAHLDVLPTQKIPAVFVASESRERYDASALDGIGYGNTEYYEPDFSGNNDNTAENNANDNQQHNKQNDDSPIDNISSEESAYIGAIDKSSIKKKKKPRYAPNPKVLAVIAVIIALAFAGVGYGVYTALSRLDPSTSQIQSMEDNTGNKNSVDDGTALIEDSGYDSGRLTQNVKSFVGEFFTFKQSEIIDGSWEKKWESYVDLSTHNSEAYGDILMITQMDDWKESVKQHPAYNSTVKSFDSIRWELDDDSQPVCFMKITLERPILDLYLLNSPAIDAKVYQDTYSITFSSDYKIIKVNRKQSTWLDDKTISSEEQELIKKDNEEYGKYIDEAAKKAAEDQKTKKDEEDQKTAEEKAKQEAAAQEETQKQREYAQKQSEQQNDSTSSIPNSDQSSKPSSSAPSSPSKSDTESNSNSGSAKPSSPTNSGTSSNTSSSSSSNSNTSGSSNSSSSNTSSGSTGNE